MTVSKENPYSSIDLAFDWVKGVLYHQKQLAEEYSAKIATLLSVATAILGIGLPLGVKFGEDILVPFTGSFIGVLVASAAYFVIAISAVVGFWMRDLDVLDDPVILREYYWTMADWKFKEQILGHLEEAYKRNQKTLQWRVWPAQLIVLLLPVETIALVVATVLAL